MIRNGEVALPFDSSVAVWQSEGGLLTGLSSLLSSLSGSDFFMLGGRPAAFGGVIVSNLINDCTSLVVAHTPNLLQLP